jgi:hypothetical protein
MSKEQVRSLEKSTFIQDTGKLLFFTGTISGMDTYILYGFKDGVLNSGSYSIRENFVNENNYIERFEDLRKQLITKYGEPFLDDVIWKNNLYRDDPDRFGLAVSSGHLEYRTNFKGEGETIISLSLSGENYESKLGIMYVEISKDVKPYVADGL